MRSTHRDRSNHRRTFISAVILILLCAVLLSGVSANSAEYYVSQDGTSLEAEVTLVNQSSYILSGLGFLGEDVELEAANVTLTALNGTVVEFEKRSSTEIIFPEGDYTLTYTAPITENIVYAKYVEPFNVSVYLPHEFDTGHNILGTVEYGGEAVTVQDSEEYGKVIIWEEQQVIHMRFFSKSLETPFYIFVAVWGVIFAVFGLRYWYLLNKPKKDLEKEGRE